MKKFPNIRERLYKSGNIVYNVRIGFNRKRFSITFQDLEEAKDWLENNYYSFMEDPEKYFKMKRKNWL